MLVTLTSAMVRGGGEKNGSERMAQNEPAQLSGANFFEPKMARGWLLDCGWMHGENNNNNNNHTFTYIS